MKTPHPSFVAAAIALTTFAHLPAFAQEFQPTAQLADYRVVEQQANVFTSNSQVGATLATASDGTTLVAWGSRRQEQGTYGIYGRLFDAAGQPMGDEIHINQFMANNQEHPAVAFDDAGNAWVVWNSYTQDGDQGTIIVRRFGMVDGKFAPLGNEMIVNTQTSGDQFQPTIATSGNTALVAWTTVQHDRQVIHGRAFDADGQPVGDEFEISNRIGLNQWLPVIAGQPSGKFVVAWAARKIGGQPVGIYGQRVAADGSMHGHAFVIAEPGERNEIEPSIAADAAGNFVVAWLGTNDHNKYDALVRRFAADGAPLSDAEVAIAADVDWQSGVTVTAAPDGRYLIAVNVEGEIDPHTKEKSPKVPATIVAQRFERDGQPIDEPFRINQTNESRQVLSIAANHPRMAWTADDRITAAWNGKVGDDSSGIAMTQFVPSSLVVETKEAGIADEIVAKVITLDDMSNALIPPVFDPNHVPEPLEPLNNPGTDFGFVGFQNTGWTPPDPDLAVGPNHVVAVVNGGIRIYTKDGTLQFDTSISGTDGFWGGIGAESFVFDPIAVYDQMSGRFIVAASEHADNGDEVLDLAVSVSSDPNDGWHKYRFNTTSIGGFIDFPNLGVGPDAIYITCDYFSNPTGNWIHIFDKQRMMDGLSVTPKFVQTSGGFRSLGAVTSLDANQPAQYFITAETGNSSRLEIDAVTDPNGTPSRTTFSLTVPGYSSPPGAEQLGSSNRVSTVGKRIKHGVLRNGHLWTAHTTGENNTARVRWYQIDMQGWPASGQNPVLVQSGTQNLGNGVHNWFADIHVDEFGRAALAFNQSSASEFVSVQRTFRLPNDPTGTLRPPTLQQVSNSPETGSRWGDYSGVDQDPVEPGVFWNHHEYRTSSWRTWVGRFDILEGLTSIAFVYPNGRPENIQSSGGTGLMVDVIPQTGIPAAGTAVLWVNTGKSFEPFPMQDLGNNQYLAIFPPTECGTVVEYYISAEDTSGEEVTDPIDAPATFYTANSFSEFETPFADDFETNTGWTVQNVDLDDGGWNRGIPVGGGDRGDPANDFDGSGACYLTDNADGNSDVDGGPTRLISPAIDLDGVSPGAQFSFAVWFSNDDNDGDRLLVEISDDDGANWTLVQQYGNTNGWLPQTFFVDDFITPTANVRLRFSATDNPNDSVTEAAVDAIMFSSIGCPSGETFLVDFQFTFGTLLNGVLDDMVDSDDVYVRGNSSFGFLSSEPNVSDLQVGAVTTVGSPGTIDLTIEGRLNNPNGTTKVRLRNWNTNALNEVDQFTLGTTEIVHNVSDIPAADYVRSSDGRVELSIRQIVVATFSLSGFQTRIDQVVVDVN